MRVRLLTAVAVLGLTLCDAGAAAQQAAAPKLASRFLITTRPLRGLTPPRLEIVGRSGRVIRVVARVVNDAALSPNHKLLAWDGKDGIHVAGVRSSKSRLLLRLRCPASGKGGFGACGGPLVWSPDSRKIMFPGTDNSLDVVSLKSRKTHRIVAPHKHVTYSPIAWSGPANQILFTVSGQKLVIALPSGALRRTLYSAADAVHDGPAASWSPSGKWIGFTTDGRGAPKDPRLEIVAAATGAKQRVPSFNGFTAPPVWSTDSSRFVVGSHDGPLLVFAPEGKKLGSLGQVGAVPVAWTRGGLYFWSGRTEAPRQLRVLPANGSARTVFTLPKGQALLAMEPI
jgi:hypothetical protein